MGEDCSIGTITLEDLFEVHQFIPNEKQLEFQLTILQCK